MSMLEEVGQPRINIGTAGHVDHGKTTLVQALTGVWTAKHSEEIRRGITIKLGYAFVTTMKCPRCLPPENYTTYAMSNNGYCVHCGSKLIPLRNIAFVDCPGHDMLIATMLSGASVMDAAIVVIDSTMPCPQPQTREHLKALEIIGLKNIIVVQNKIDVVTKERALESYKEIKNTLEEYSLKEVPIIPVSALHKINLDLVVEAIEKFFPNPIKDETRNPLGYVIRSFDVNKPGTNYKDLKGGVLGSSIVEGFLEVGQEIEIKPGLRLKKEGKVTYEPLITRIVNLRSENIKLKKAVPGGLIGIETELDPSLTKNDQLVGNVISIPGKSPPVWDSLEIEFELFKFVIGTKETMKVEPIKLNEELAINAGAARSIGIVTSIKGNKLSLNLSIPICANVKSRVAISRKIQGKWRLVGYGIIV